MKRLFITAFVALSLSGQTIANEQNTHDSNIHGKACENFGPQTPRDIDNTTGTNNVAFTMALPASEMHLCDIHFHENAEHKADAFSLYAGDGHNGYGGGYQCKISKSLNQLEMSATKEDICSSEHGDLKPGDTIEVHWVYSSCDVEPGPTLGSCSSEACVNPTLRVETQVFTLANDSNALDFKDMQQAGSLPKDTGKPVEFLGSTTGPTFSEQACSPYQVTWSVRPKCAKLDINTIGEWCKSNVFKEDHAHGVRKLVTNPKLLSNIK